MCDELLDCWVNDFNKHNYLIYYFLILCDIMKNVCSYKTRAETEIVKFSPHYY